MEIKRCYDTIVGASVVENQLVNLPDGTRTISGITTVRSDGVKISYSGTATDAGSYIDVYAYTDTDSFLTQFIAGHRYLMRAISSDNKLYIVVNKPYTDMYGANGREVIYTPSETPSYFYIRVLVRDEETVNGNGYLQIIDLTALFGSSIADYLYNLESATAGAGIAKLREWGFLTGGYIPYNAGTLESVEATAHKMVGFNCWNSETDNLRKNIGADGNLMNNNAYATSDYIPVLPNTTYYAKNVGPSANVRTCYLYDSEKNPLSDFSIGGASGIPVSGNITTTDKTRYVRLVRFINQTEFCFSLSNPDRNGEYEPYISQTYALGSDKLRGIFKLDANNNLYADGDVKTSDGVITRYYGTRAYQSGDESLADAITDGTTTVYKLTTPTTETSTPFQSPQIVYPDGTEEFITENHVPVGHETKYQL